MLGKLSSGKLKLSSTLGEREGVSKSVNPFFIGGKGGRCGIFVGKALKGKRDGLSPKVGGGGVELISVSANSFIQPIL